MNFAFTQIYSEPGTSFGLAGIFLNTMRSELDSLGLSIERIQARFPSLEVTIVLIITASTTASSVVLTKPIFLRKKPEVEFAVRMPYRELQDPIERCQWVCTNVFEAVSELYKRYTLSPPDMTHALNASCKRYAKIQMLVYTSTRPKEIGVPHQASICHRPNWSFNRDVNASHCRPLT